ncbi:MAG: hypothetical protein OEU89_08790 [Burkholderiaceae bacterium]|nr:hypothetical protein [Burkholderiaceae bacterium]
MDSIVVDDKEMVWVRRCDFLQLLDTCTDELGTRYLDHAHGYQKSDEASCL